MCDHDRCRRTRAKRIAVVGVGNILMGDEGVGVAVVEELAGRVDPQEVELVDAGTGLFLMASDLEPFEAVIIVDAARGGCEPGSLYRFDLDDLGKIAEFRDGPISLHDFGVPEAIAWERARGRLRGEVVFFGIEPKMVEPGLGISEALKSKMGALVDRIIEELSRLGAHVKP